MAEQSGEASSSSSVTEAPATAQLHEEIDKIKDLHEPEKKKRKLLRGDGKSEQKLEHRLGGILCCAVCLDLPRAAVYQVSYWHVILGVIILGSFVLDRGFNIINGGSEYEYEYGYGYRIEILTLASLIITFIFIIMRGA